MCEGGGGGGGGDGVVVEWGWGIKCQLEVECTGYFGYRNNHNYWDRQALENGVDPDQPPQNAASDYGLQYLSLIQ